MPRAKTTVPGRARRRKVLKAAKGNYGGRRKLYKSALQTLQRAGQFAYEHRRTRKRDFRRLWIIRINAAARDHGLSYNKPISRCATRRPSPSSRRWQSRRWRERHGHRLDQRARASLHAP